MKIHNLPPLKVGANNRTIITNRFRESYLQKTGILINLLKIWLHRAKTLTLVGMKMIPKIRATGHLRLLTKIRPLTGAMHKLLKNC